MTEPAYSHFEFHLKPTRQPMLWAAVFYCAGIIASPYAKNSVSALIAAVGAFLVAGVFLCRRCRLGVTLLSLTAIFLVGILNIRMSRATPAADSSLSPYAYGPEIQLIAHVTGDGKLKQTSPAEFRQTLDVESEEVVTDQGLRTRVHSGIRLSLYRDRATSANHGGTSATRMFHYGERISVPVKLKLPRNFRNPGAFDFESYLANRGISGLASGKQEEVVLLPGFAGNRMAALRSRVHASILAKVEQLWPAPQAVLIDAMVIGEEAFIDRDTRVDFQRSGTYHILVVSGMNVTILAFVAFWTLRRLQVPEIPATLLTILCCVGYALLTEVGAPVWRATLMCAIFLGTRLLYRERAMLNGLGAAALGLLVYDPRQLFAASFQMTFLCVLVVAAIGLPLVERSSGFYRPALAHWEAEDYGATLSPHAAQFRSDLRLIASRLSRFVGKPWALRLIRSSTLIALHAFELLLISVVMQMGLALPMAYYFHRATTIGLPANMAVVPLTQMLMPMAILTVALGYVSLLIAKLPALITGLALQAITGTVHGLGTLHLADLRVATPSLLKIGVASAALILSMTLARKRVVLAAFGMASLLAAGVTLAFLPPPPQVEAGKLEVTSIDVGEGDSILLITPQGRTLLVDAGGPTWGASSQLDFGEDVVAPYLWTRRITRLDAVAISHGHSDHIGGMPAILKDFRPKELWVGLLPPSRALDNLIGEAHALGIQVVRHWEGDSFVLGGAKVEVLFPPRDWPVGLEPKNNDSMVMQVSYGATSVLLEGDAEKAVERRIAAIHHPRAQLLKVGHHGSATSSTPEMLASVKPLYAVISVGFHTSYGLPKEDVLTRLKNSGAHIYRTDLDGLVSFYLDGRSVTPYVPALELPGAAIN